VRSVAARNIDSRGRPKNPVPRESHACPRRFAPGKGDFLGGEIEKKGGEKSFAAKKSLSIRTAQGTRSRSENQKGQAISQ